jgi:hypothetical protein
LNYFVLLGRLDGSGDEEVDALCVFDKGEGSKARERLLVKLCPYLQNRLNLLLINLYFYEILTPKF